MEKLIHYEFPHNRIQIDIHSHMVEYHAKVAAVVEDAAEAAIVEAVIAAAQAEGVTDLYLMDKTFILDAIREKLEREKPKPLTIEELRQVNGEPLWLTGFEWRVCYGTATFRGSEYLETGLSSSIPLDGYGQHWFAYRHKPRQEDIELYGHWIYWDGWCGNHDRRIDDATCSVCGYKHPTVRATKTEWDTRKFLSDTCPGCGVKMKKGGVDNVV